MGLGHSPSQTDPYVMFFIPEADIDAHNVRQEMGQIGIQGGGRWKQHVFERTRKGIMTGWDMGALGGILIQMGNESPSRDGEAA